LNEGRYQKLERTLKDFDEATRRRGMLCFAQNRVKYVEAKDDLIAGVVEGMETYVAAWIYEDGEWISDCSCPAGDLCKHVFALAMEALAGARKENPSVGRQREPAPKIKPFSLKDEIARRTGNKLTKADKKTADQIESLHREVVRRNQRSLDAADLRRVGLSAPKPTQLWREPRVLEGWWKSAPATSLDLWQYIALYAEREGIPIPEFLKPLTDLTAIRAEIEDKLRHKEIARWRTLLSEMAQPSAPPPSARPLRLRLALPKIHWEEESSPGYWQRLPADRVRELAQEKMPGRDGASVVLLALASRNVAAGYWGRSNFALSLTREEDAAFLNAALSNPVSRERVVGPDGLAFRFADAPLRWEFRPSERDPENEIEARVLAPDGTTLPKDILVFPGPVPLALVQGRIYQAPLPLHKGDKPYAAAFIPLAALKETPEAVAALKKGGAIFPGSIEAGIETVPLSPCLVCDLHSPGGGYAEELRIRLLAHSPAHKVEKIWCGPYGWQFTTPATKARVTPQGRVMVFDLAAADAVVPVLATLRLGFASQHNSWVRSVTKKFPEEFAAWAQSLPPGIEIRAAPELRAFFEPAAAASLRFEIEERPDAPDWFDLRAELSVNDVELTSEETEALLKARGGFVRLNSGAWKRLEARFDEEDSGALAAMGLTLASALAAERHSFHALQLAGSHASRLAGGAMHERIVRRAGAIRAIPSPDLPAGFLGTLRPYQQEGFHFLAFLASNNFGGVLADDMGLGKTIQGLAWLLWLRDRATDSGFRALVVCPKSVIYNWSAETVRFAPALNARPFTPGTDIPAQTTSLVIANYTQLRLNAPWFLAQKWDAVILDEGQNIKNPGSQTAKTARALTALQRLVLTGTPIENRALDLWSLYAFAQPGLLGSQASFKRLYESRTSDDTTGLIRLQARVRHFLLRRTKAQVAPELPPRTEEELHCALDGAQAALYSAELKKTRRLVLGLSSKDSFDQARFNILQSLLRLRQICCDPRLITRSREKSAPSAKMEALFDQLRPLVEEGHKILVFSQFVEMLSLISDELTRESIPHLTLTGQTENRQKLVEKFQSDPSIPVFLLSLKAAGTGLNLTAASYVILYDPWWNPAAEAQAIDRTHRIGQVKPVIAYRLIAKDTIEEKIRALQKQKSAVADAVIHEESLAKVLDLDSLRFLLAE